MGHLCDVTFACFWHFVALWGLVWPSFGQLWAQGRKKYIFDVNSPPCAVPVLSQKVRKNIICSTFVVFLFRYHFWKASRCLFSRKCDYLLSCFLYFFWMSDATAHLKNMHLPMVFTGVLAHAPFSKTSKWHVFAYNYCVRVPDIKTIIFCWICDVILGALSGHSGHFH